MTSTPGGLVKATFGAAIAAGAILTLVWLPAEYGIDPTGVGGALGLTEMGQIKTQLKADADSESDSPASHDYSDVDESVITEKLDQIQTELAKIAVAVDALSTNTVEGSAATLTGQDPVNPSPDTHSQSVVTWRDEVSYALSPGEGIEVKLAMDEGAVADFEWNANGAVLNHDTHGDGNGQSISYEKGRAIPGQEGRLTAAFTGNHGWYWRNRTKAPVVVTLRTRGAYNQMVLP